MKQVLVLQNDLTIEYTKVPKNSKIVILVKTELPTITDIMQNKNEKPKILPVITYKLEIQEFKYNDKTFYYALEDEDNDRMYLIIQFLIIGKVLGILREKHYN